MNPQIFSLIAEESFLGLIVFSLPDRVCQYMNRTAMEYLDFVSPNISEFRFASMFPVETAAGNRFRPFSEDFLEFEGLTQDVLVKKLSGNSFIADVGIRILNVDSKQYLLVRLRDVTLQKKMQRDLTAKQTEIQAAYAEMLEQNKQLKDLDRAKDKFIALTTHELRTPLSAMIATAEVLVLKLYDTDEQRDDFIKTIHTEGLHLLEIVNDILDFAKIQAGKMDFYIEEQDVVELVQTQCISFAQMAEAKGVKIRTEIDLTKYPAYYDALRFRQSLDNVLNNAIKFTNDNTEVVLSITQESDFIKVHIKDQGPGIPAGSIAKVFNEFETVGSVNSHHKGTGLGMPITKKLMESMGGHIQLVSEVGKGATFSLSLPRKKVLTEEHYRSRPQHTDDLAA